MSAKDGSAALRARLRGQFGLELSSVSDEQLQRAVSDAGLEADLARVADHLPISESSLMRDPELWAWLSDSWFERAFDTARAEGRPLRILSLGCSEGQEVYSAALTALGVLARIGVAPSHARAFVEILGVDISAARIARARTGQLGEWSLRGAPNADVVALLERSPKGWSVSPAALAVCRFELGNVLTFSSERLREFDLVLCRHVLIYFPNDAAQEVATRLLAHLKPGAHLALAPVEAHLLIGATNAVPVGPVGAAMRPEAPAAGAGARATSEAMARSGGGAASAQPRSDSASAQRALDVTIPESARRAAAARAGAAAGSAPDVSTRDAAEAHRARVLEAIEYGRLHEALNLARAATYLEPDHLGGRFLLARVQVILDPPIGRRMLQAIVDDARRAVDSDPDLSNHQLALAASAILASTR